MASSSVEESETKTNIAVEPSEPSQPQVFSIEELREYDGTKRAEIYMGVQDQFDGTVVIFDMTAGKDFYGPGGPYEVFAGRHASYGLAKMSTNSSDVSGDLSTLAASERDTLQQWYSKFSSKYRKVGVLAADKEE